MSHSKHSRHQWLIAVMGPTCVGKSEEFKYISECHADVAGTVEVGKMLRAKYPPEYFQGQNNPKHCAEEAWDMCEKGIHKHLCDGKKYVFIDGQPRDVEQTRFMLTKFTTPVRFVMLHATQAVCEERARATRASNPNNLDLAIQRIKNDRIAYYEVMVELAKAKRSIDKVIDTTDTPATIETYMSIYREMISVCR